MNPERWRLVNDLFHRALERDAADRARFLQDVTRDDPGLLDELRSLLASHQSAGGFLEEPAWGVAAHLLLEEDSLTGKQIGAYRVLEEVGRGGMGVVYAAEDTRLGRTVALKALPGEYSRDPLRRERLTREARAAAGLSHPSIATIFALEELDGDLFLVSELVRGRTLRSEIGEGPLPPERLLSTLIDIASGLSAAHASGIVHRDLKPENIVRRTDGQIKILDFGLARSEGTAHQSTQLRLTQAGTALGTPGYMAPEQLGGGAVDARADVFAFGVTAWECATGEHPFGSDAAALLQRMTDLLDGRSPGDLSRALPVHGLNIILRRCMRGTPDDRYPSAEALLRDLEAVARAPAPAKPEADTGLWWWQFHQGTVAVVNALMPVAAWFVRRWAPRPYGAMVFFAVLALATISVTLRLHLLFTSRVNCAALVHQRDRWATGIAAVEALLAILLLIAAALLAGPYDAMAAILVTLAIVTVASLGVIEPATTSAAGLTSDGRT